MTGVAATLCSNPPPDVKAVVEEEMPGVQWGRRIAILNDLSPAAAFIAYNYNVKVDVNEFQAEAEAMLARVEKEDGLVMGQADGKGKLFAANGRGGVINYTVWSEVMTCPQCAEQIVFFDHAVDVDADPMAVRDEFPCPKCNIRLTKRSLESFVEEGYDALLQCGIRRVKRVPVFIKYLVGKQHFTKKPAADDLTLLSSVHLERDSALPAPFELASGGLSDSHARTGMTHLHHYYTPRNFLTLSHMIAAAAGRYRRQLLNLIQSISVRLCSYLTTYQLGKRGNVPMTGTLFVGSLLAEANPIKSLEGKLRDFTKVYETLQQSNFVSCGSSSKLSSIPDSSIDYIFIDPPFGDNLNYSQLNLLWEGWLRCAPTYRPKPSWIGTRTGILPSIRRSSVSAWWSSTGC